MSTAEHKYAIAFATEYTINSYITIERDLFIENFDCNHNLESFSKFRIYIIDNEPDIYNMIVLFVCKMNDDEHVSNVRSELYSVYNELKRGPHKYV